MLVLTDGHHALGLTLALLLAWAIDLRFGEPRNAWHPVAWLGWLMRPAGVAMCRLPAPLALGGGILVWWAAACALGAGAWALQSVLLSSCPLWLAVPALAVLLKPLFAWRMLRDEVVSVEQALVGQGGEAAARQRLSRLVSRDVSGLGADALRETAIETLSENLGDSVIAPLFWYAVAGLPGAVAYRMANTLDAMWGYRGRWEWAGKWAARADAVLSWLPSRLTAGLLMILWRSPSRSAWAELRRQARLTPSPNGGWPMGAMALRLGVRLGKPGAYVLNPAAATPDQGHLARAIQAAGQAAVAGMLMAAAAGLARACW